MHISIVMRLEGALLLLMCKLGALMWFVQKWGHEFGAGRQRPGHHTTVLVLSGGFAFQQVGWRHVTTHVMVFRAWRKRQQCQIHLARAKMHLMEDLAFWSKESWEFLLWWGSCSLSVIYSLCPRPKISCFKALTNMFLLTGARACIFFFFSDGGQHARCRRDRTYLFLSASISHAIHEQRGVMMNDDVCVLLYSFTGFFKLFSF